MRAIALDGSLTARLRKDETLYTLNEAVEKLHDMGYDIRRSEHGRLPMWPPLSNTPPAVEAELQTACGCTKRMFIERTRTIRIPFNRGIPSQFIPDPSAGVTFMVRDFEFRRMEVRDGLPIAIYVETM